MVLDWLDVDRLETGILVSTVLASALALCALCLVRSLAWKLVAVVLLVGLAASGIAYRAYLEDARRTDCNQVWLVDRRVPVPHCPASSAT